MGDVEPPRPGKDSISFDRRLKENNRPFLNDDSMAMIQQYDVNMVVSIEE